MTAPAAQTALWRETAGAPLDAAPLSGEIETDVVILGAGFTGLAAALRAAERGASVAVLEAETVGHGGSGRNVGLVNAGLWTPPDDVERLLGAEAGRRLNAALAAGPATVFALIDRLGMACEARRTGTLHLAHSQAGLEDLRARCAQQVARGAPVTLLDAEAAAERTGAAGCHGALHDARAGTIQPLAYARGLARAAQAAGARIYERSPAGAPARDGAGWRVETPGGAVRARRLIRAVNAYGGEAGRYTVVHYFQLATAPLPDNLGAPILKGGEGCWDTAPVMSSFRRDAEGRLILGAVGRLDGPTGAAHRGWARRKLAALFPDLADQPFEHAWSGRIAMTSDHLPKVVRLGDGALDIYGYSGRGIAPGTVFGTAAADWALDGDESALPVRPIATRPERFTGLRAAGFEAGAAATHFLNVRG
jgi:glycine/D-amino acid oxidase-like deaminating enzyme